jgi:glyoxylase-like metal-dependent hydrolase (beta-lactamase superfamily II)
MADVHVLVEGYAREGDELRVGSTVSLILDGDAAIVIDPGMVADRATLMRATRDAAIEPGDVTDIVFSHHHPDHTVNAALFEQARIHDVMATYRDDLWIDRDAEGFLVSPSVRLLATPGHTLQDVTTLVETDGGLVAFTHLWWTADGPADDPYAPDREQLRRQRERVLEIASFVVPGHGPGFTPGPSTPR